MTCPIALAKEAEPRLFGLLQRLVECESPSEDKAANDRLGQLIAAEIGPLGGEIEFAPVAEYGDHLLVRWPGRGGPGLIIGHRDTVWPTGTLRRIPYSAADGRVFGPGVLDMKGGIAATVVALELLAQSGSWPARPLTVLINSDEEKGSPTSRPLIESEARNAAYVVVMEPGQGPKGRLATRRKGVGEFRISVEGEACHASLVPTRGVSAIKEMAGLISRVYQLGAPDAGTNVNVGLVSGGTARNTVPAHAECVVDVRVTDHAEAARISKAIRELEPTGERARIEVNGGFHRPPMERTPANVELLRRVKSLAGELGISLEETSAPGGSDANLTAALDVPTIDSMGAVGENAHAEGEYVVAAELVRRTGLLVHILRSL
jgi:glutamate carboxypeptidase